MKKKIMYRGKELKEGLKKRKYIGVGRKEEGTWRTEERKWKPRDEVKMERK